MQKEKRIGIKLDAGDHLCLRSLFVGSNILLELGRLTIPQKFPIMDRKDSNGLFEFRKVSFNIQGRAKVG